MKSKILLKYFFLGLGNMAGVFVCDFEHIIYSSGSNECHTGELTCPFSVYMFLSALIFSLALLLSVVQPNYRAACVSLTAPRDMTVY